MSENKELTEEELGDKAWAFEDILFDLQQKIKSANFSEMLKVEEQMETLAQESQYSVWYVKNPEEDWGNRVNRVFIPENINREEMSRISIFEKYFLYTNDGSDFGWYESQNC